MKIRCLHWQFCPNAVKIELRNFDELRIVLHCIPKFPAQAHERRKPDGIASSCMWVNRTNPRGLNHYRENSILLIYALRSRAGPFSQQLNLRVQRLEMRKCSRLHNLLCPDSLEHPTASYCHRQTGYQSWPECCS